MEQRGKRRETVRLGLLRFGTTLPKGGSFTGGDADADSFLRDNPFALLMAASIDRGTRAELVWKTPWLLMQKLGHLDPARFSLMTPAEVEQCLRQLPKKPRFPNQAARTIVSLAELVSRELGGNAEMVWTGRTVALLLGFLQRVYGVGPGIAAMTVRILIDEGLFRPQRAELSQIDIKPDVQVTRVFYRSGLSESRDGQECIYTARTLCPEFPGKLDWPAWEIGRKYCHESNPDCSACPLNRICPKKGT